MGILQVELFGVMRVTQNNWLNEVIMTREIQALLAYLLLQRRRVHSREVLSGMFWGKHSQERARGSLNTALWKLKKALEPEGIPAGTYLKNTHLKVLELYKADLLEGFYDNWALRERERLRTLYLKSLIYQYYGFHGACESAIAYGQQILDLDPLREEIHREMMRLYLENGQRTLSLRQYEICRSTLAEELGISPMEDTQALYAQIFGGGDRNRILTTSGEQINVGQAIGQLREAGKAIELANEQIQQALQLIAKFSEPPK